MNLHLVPNSGFLNQFITTTEEICGADQNVFVVTIGRHETVNKTIKKVTKGNAAYCAYGSKDFYNLIGDISKYNIIFFHLLSNDFCDFINQNKQCSAKFNWVFWGADLFTPFGLFANALYDKDSLNYFNKFGTYTTTNNSIVNFAKKIKYFYLKSYIESRAFKKRKSAASKIENFLHYNHYDYDLAKSTYHFSAKFTPFFYLEYDYNTIEPLSSKDVLQFKTNLQLGDSFVIQIGHSGSLSNNHISALHQFSRLASENILIICPLSYGDKKYCQHVIEIGKSIYGEKFIPLTTFLPKDKYLQYLSAIDIAVMNHKRSEAGSNIVTLIALGKEVFLREENNFRKHLNENQIETNILREEAKYSLEDLQLIIKNGKKKIELNSKLVINLFSSDKSKLLLNSIYKR